MRKQFCLVCILGLISVGSFAQAREDAPPPKPLFSDQKIRPEWMDRLRYGGNFWLQFWQGLYVDVTPMVGYEIGNTGKTVVGVGVPFTYSGRVRLVGGQPNTGSSQSNKGVLSIGGSVFLRQNIFKSIFLHTEYQIMNAPADLFFEYKKSSPTTGIQAIPRVWGGTPYLGVGIYRGGKPTRGSFISLLYNPLASGVNPRGFNNQNSFGGNILQGLVVKIGFF